MLQQTQVQTVIPYFQRFMAAFPTIASLAQASDDQVMALWAGLGYYSRARNLHRAAQLIMQDFDGEMPKTLQALQSLPGIGQTTAAAICAQAYDQPTAILDGNVKRVLTRFYRIAGNPDQGAVKQQLWDLAQQAMPPHRCADYTQAIMDLGATLCTPKNPACDRCPLQHDCQARRHDCVSQYPSPKIKKQLPSKKALFLVLHDAGKIYLEKRPPEGIWGGLWSLPSLTEAESLSAYVQSIGGQTPVSLLKFKHSFTHFHLYIHALSVAVVEPNLSCSPTACWFELEQIRHLGLPKPCSQIIQHWGALV